MTTVIEQLTTPLTSAEVRAAIYETIAAKGVDTTSWKPGAVVRTMIAGSSIVLAGLSRVVALIAKSGFLELAEGDWLTLVARYVYDVERSLGTYATGYVTLDNSGGGVFSGGAGDLVALDATTNKTFRSTSAWSVAAYETGVQVEVRADEIGSASTAQAGDIDELVTSLLGVTVTNAAALVGSDAESDPDLRERCRAKTGALSPNGPADAYEFFARSATRADGTSVGVTRVLPVPDGSGGITIYVATASGGVTGTVGDLNTDLGVVADAIEKNVVPLAITETVTSAVAANIAVTYELWLSDTISLDDDEIEETIETQLVDFMAGQPIGGTVIGADPGRVYRSAIEAAIASEFDGYVVKLAVTAPAGDTDIATNAAPVLDGSPTVTAIHRVSGGSF